MSFFAMCRRGGIGNDQDLMEHCCILVHTAKACAGSQLATVLAAWLHWYGRLDLHTAIQVQMLSHLTCPDAQALSPSKKPWSVSLPRSRPFSRKVSRREWHHESMRCAPCSLQAAMPHDRWTAHGPYMCLSKASVTVRTLRMALRSLISSVH